MEQMVWQGAMVSRGSGSLMVVSGREKQLLDSFRSLQEREQSSILRFADVLRSAPGPRGGPGPNRQIDQA